MHVDHFIAIHRPTWARLETLVRRASRRGLRALDDAELEELLVTYQRTSTHLSTARTRLRDEALVASLSSTVAAAAALLHGRRVRTLAAVGRFVARSYPAALWRARGAITAAFLVFAVAAVGAGWFVANTPAALDAAIPPELQEAIVAEDFEAYYTETPSAQFFATVGLNNIQVGLLAFAAGIAWGLGTVYVLAFNGLHVGVAGGLFHAHGAAEVFWGNIAPHGLLELTAVFVVGGAGLQVGWALVEPGDVPRAQALAATAQRAASLVLGTAGVFVVAAVIEGFVTGSPLPTALRVAIGVAAEVAFLVYAGVLGSRAAAEGFDGRLGEQAYSRPAALTSR